ncbi:MAG: flavin reductase family protein [Promethearchaeota archaeon]
MKKNKIQPGTYLFPLPVVIIGAKVGDKANFMTVAWCSVVENKPPILLISTSKKHHTNKGIRKNQTFSINIPSEELVEVTDFIGIRSGKDLDKSDLFDVFYGELETAPMIQEAAVNMECKVIKTIELEEEHEIFIGQVIQAYSDKKYLTNGILDIGKIKPLIYATGQKSYWNVGEEIGKAWNIGREYVKK